MKTYLEKMAMGLRALFRLTPTRVHNVSLLTGIGLLTAAAALQFGQAAALAVAGGLVLAYTTLERILLFVRSRT